ncbi:phytanoyl-CoA dioxygenase family protein [Chitinasiproducens palmae]|uniref:Phytanoyl-CoA hydroxylase n=1 Tax=Chitinasiproducens palmae TaxID=1770053 RepID=A0A1H2PPA5_9BURK|nr:phytanoyl-CoA dioxygenase family protein [Chitinasiproducens palmae]SDV48470.1 phytanoyl-CoA hydroxylase [Chitinasiproducens palmae]
MAAQTQKEQIGTLLSQGFVVVPGLLDRAAVGRLREVAAAQLARRAAPLELEADLRYPGAPASRDELGGDTVRRLLDAYGRSPAFAEIATLADIRGWMRTFFGEPAVLSRAHHNCLMTKHPRHGSLTGWHRDARYWSFTRDELVSAWVALGDETASNGGLWFIPGSHRIDFPRERFDDAKFFRNDHAENATLIQHAVCPTLAAGDVVFFHCNTLHSAGQNLSDAVKYSLVFTYHGVSNTPVPGTRSAAKPEVPLD